MNERDEHLRTQFVVSKLLLIDASQYGVALAIPV